MDARHRLDEISRGYQDAIVLITANHLGVLAALAGGPRTPSALATELQLDGRALAVVLHGLAAIGVLDRREDGHFQLNAAFAPLLTPGNPQTITSMLSHHYHLLARWVQLPDVLRSGRPADVGEHSPGALRAFICGMRDVSRRSSREVADTVPEIGACSRLLDLGGGPGTSALTFCDRWESLHAVVFDLPEVVPIAREEIAAANLADRVTTLAGDYLEDPLIADGEPLYDAVYLSNIIHSLDDAQTHALLARAVAALAPGGLLVVKDFFLSESRTAPAQAARFAVNMLVNTPGGKSYTWTEVETMLADLGVAEPSRRPVAIASGLLVARRS